MAPAITIDALSFTYQGRTEPSLTNITVSVEQGEMVAIMGHAGSGKSTLCMCLNALIPHFIKGEIEGRVVVLGHEVQTSSIRDLAQVAALVFQDFESQLVSSTVEQELAFGPENYGVPRTELKRCVDKYLPILGSHDLRNQNPSVLSVGQRQLLALASSLTLETGIVIFDEVTTDLDPSNRHKVISVARQLVSEGRVVIMVEHEPEVAMCADKILLLNNGEVLAYDRTHTLLSRGDLLEKAGVRPHQLIDLFERLGINVAPLDIDAALNALQETLGTLRVSQTATSVTANNGASLLDAQGVSYTYDGMSDFALDQIDIRIRAGEVVAILGHNASGKSTLGKILSGLLRPSEGTILIEGRDAGALSRREVARLVGFVFQNPANQIFATTVHEEISFGPRNFGQSEEDIDLHMREVLDALELNGYQQLDPFALTKGEQQRVAIASVLISRPRVLILDEPTTGLDYRQQRSMMGMLSQLSRDGHTVIFITHSMWLAAEYASRTIVLAKGRVVSDGPTRDVLLDEERLALYNIEPPPIVRLTNRLGLRAKSVVEAVDEIRHLREQNLS